ncbi:MAG: hypothetical protein QMD77_02745 [Patescibacteria group bacterium]|nr:hypothetical protein [Patescibacteria group bacterium]
MEEKERHPLVYQSPVGIHSWEEWKEYWKRTDLPVEFRHSLLHFGFQAEANYPEDFIDQVKFYLSLADGYRWEDNFIDQKPENEKFYLQTCFGSLYPHEIRQLLARKTFDVLCTNLFKDVSKSWSAEPSWAEKVCNEEILKVILHFFRTTPAFDGRRFVNLTCPPYKMDNHEQTAAKFLLQLIELAWPVGGASTQLLECWKHSMEMFERFYSSFIGVLDGLRRLDILLARYKIINNVCLSKLEELALGQDEQGEQKFKTLEEANLAGSQAAEILILLRLKQKEHQRQKVAGGVKLFTEKHEAALQ